MIYAGLSHSAGMKKAGGDPLIKIRDIREDCGTEDTKWAMTIRRALSGI